MKKSNKSILSALLLVVLFAAWLIAQRTGLLGGGAATPLVDPGQPRRRPDHDLQGLRKLL